MRNEEMIYRALIEASARTQPSAEVESVVLDWCRSAEVEGLAYPYISLGDSVPTGFAAPSGMSDESLIEAAALIADIDRAIDDCGRWIVYPIVAPVLYVSGVDSESRLKQRRIGTTKRPHVEQRAAVAYIGKPAKESSIASASTARAIRAFG